MNFGRVPLRITLFAFTLACSCVACFAPVLAATPKPLLVVYVGNTPSDLTLYENWIGRRVDGVQLHTGRNGWADYTGSVGWIQGIYSGVDRLKFWSVPLIAGGNSGATLALGGSGSYDSYWTEVASTLANGQPTGAIHVRTGWEFNGNWQEWASAGKEADYIACFRRFVSCFRAVSSRFNFEWCANIGQANPADSYPGNDYVDIVGMDFYYDLQYYSANATAAWDNMRTQTYGLQWLETFAASKGKPTAYSEWGVQSTNAGPYVNLAAQWFNSHNVVYQSYWNSNADFAGRLDQNQYPGAGAAYKTAFGPSAIEAWRYQWFGDHRNIAASADTATPAADGIPNLIKFVTGDGTTDPKLPARPPAVTTVAKGAEIFSVTFTRNKAAIAGGAQARVWWSDTLLPDSWSTTGVILDPVVDQGTTELVTARIPLAAGGSRYARLEVVAAE